MKKMFKILMIGLMTISLSGCKEDVVCECPSDAPNSEEVVIEVSNHISQLYEEVIDENVTVFSGTTSFGSGFVFEEDATWAYIMTNAHVIKNTSSVEVLFSNNIRVSAQVYGLITYEDLAFLKVARSENYKVATLGSSANSKVGDLIFAIGTPLDVLYRGSVSSGVISGKDYYVKDVDKFMMMIDVVINPGNSGGPLYDAEGKVIGINTLKDIRKDETVSSGTMIYYNSLNFSIPIDRAVQIWEVFKADNSYRRPYLPIEYEEIATISLVRRQLLGISPEITHGLFVTKINGGSFVMEIILEVNGKEIYRASDYEYEVYKFKEGDLIDLEVINKNGTNQMTKTLTLLGK